jgi:hypothetical protein
VSVRAAAHAKGRPIRPARGFCTARWENKPPVVKKAPASARAGKGNGGRSSSLVLVRTPDRPPVREYMLGVVVPVTAGSAGRALKLTGYV